MFRKVLSVRYLIIFLQLEATFDINVQSNSKQWRIQNFPEVGAPTLKVGVLTYFLAENCMKMKEFGPFEPGGERVTGAPFPPSTLDPPMVNLTGDNVTEIRWTIETQLKPHSH